MNSLWLVITALAAFLVAYRFYGAFLAAKVAVLNDGNVTPAHRLRDDVDYHPTRRLVLFGVHFAAIAGSGPLVGPVLASQWGYFPGFCWIVIGSCLAGGVHDFVVLLASVRQDGQSLPKIARNLLGPVVGHRHHGGHAVHRGRHAGRHGQGGRQRPERKRLGHVHDHRHDPGGPVDRFLDEQDPPRADRRGVADRRYDRGAGRDLRQDRSTIPCIAAYLIFSPRQLSIILPAYAAMVSILPVWVLLCPRDYLSSYMKVGVIVLLGVGILVAQPTLKMPATTPFIHGGGPIARHGVAVCVHRDRLRGASGFHALIASGTTPKMLNKESDIRRDRLRRHAAGGLRFVHGPDRRLRLGAGRLLQDQHRKRPL